MKKLTVEEVEKVLNDFALNFKDGLEKDISEVDIVYLLEDLCYDESVFISTLDEYEKNRKVEPSGQFLIYYEDNDCYAVGDNRSGDILVEDFKKREEAILWLTEIADYEFIKKYGRQF